MSASVKGQISPDKADGICFDYFGWLCSITVLFIAVCSENQFDIIQLIYRGLGNVLNFIVFKTNGRDLTVTFAERFFYDFTVSGIAQSLFPDSCVSMLPFFFTRICKNKIFIRRRVNCKRGR